MNEMDEISDNDMEESINFGSKKDLDKKIKDFETIDPGYAEVLKKYGTNEKTTKSD